jgi:hypothetical protein
MRRLIRTGGVSIFYSHQKFVPNLLGAMHGPKVDGPSLPIDTFIYS